MGLLLLLNHRAWAAKSACNCCWACCWDCWFIIIWPVNAGRASINAWLAIAFLQVLDEDHVQLVVHSCRRWLQTQPVRCPTVPLLRLTFQSEPPLRSGWRQHVAIVVQWFPVTLFEVFVQLHQQPLLFKESPFSSFLLLPSTSLFTRSLSRQSQARREGQVNKWPGYSCGRKRNGNELVEVEKFEHKLTRGMYCGSHLRWQSRGRRGGYQIFRDWAWPTKAQPQCWTNEFPINGYQ